MVRRTTRSDDFVDRQRLLDALATCRKAVIDEKGRMKAGGALYYSASAVVAAIDGLGLMLTGSENAFYDEFAYGPKREGEEDRQR